MRIPIPSASKTRTLAPVRTSRVVSALFVLLAPSAIACANSSEQAASPVRDVAMSIDSSATIATVSDTLARSDSAFFNAGLPAVSGTLEARSRAVLRAELPGPVRVLAVRVGERVTRGMTLALLDVPAVGVNLAATNAHLAAQESELIQVSRERDRTGALMAVGGASRAELDALDARVHASAAAISAARAQIAAATADVERTTIRAPFDGVVEKNGVTQGSVVQAGDELITIVDPRVLELEGGLALAHAAQARSGVRVALRIAGWEDTTLVGRIVRVAPSVDPRTRQLRVTVELPNAGGRVPVGAWAEGTLLTDGPTHRAAPGDVAFLPRDR